MKTFKMMKNALLHPLDFFYDIQLESNNKLFHALTLIVMAIAARMVSLMLNGFLFQTKEPHQISILVEAIWIIVPWLTWSIANWGVSTIVDGEGKFIDVLSASAFSLTPYILFSIPIAALTTVLTRHSTMLSYTYNSIHLVLTIIMFVWVLFLYLISVKIIHDFELGKLLFICLLSILGMFIIWFVGILVFGLVNQVFIFVIGLFKEISFRS